MSKHNREQRALWKLGMHKRQRRAAAERAGSPDQFCWNLRLWKATHDEIRAAKIAAMVPPNLSPAEAA